MHVSTPSFICRYLHRLWWARRGDIIICARCKLSWDPTGKLDPAQVDAKLQEEAAAAWAKLPQRLARSTTIDGQTVPMEAGPPTTVRIGNRPFRVTVGGRSIQATLLGLVGNTVRCQEVGTKRVHCVKLDAVHVEDRERVRAMRPGGAS